jgi:hypothetical protein
MHIELRVPDTLDARLQVRTYDPELEDIRAILAEVCEVLEGHVQFLVSGFGQDPWPVDVWKDLTASMEQLPTALRAVKSGQDAEIHFYEQGIDSWLLLYPAGEDVPGVLLKRRYRLGSDPRGGVT